MNFDVFILAVASLVTVIWCVTKVCDTWERVTHTNVKPKIKAQLDELMDTLQRCSEHLSHQASPDAFGPAKSVDLLVLNNAVHNLVALLATRED